MENTYNEVQPKKLGKRTNGTKREKGKVMGGNPRGAASNGEAPGNKGTGENTTGVIKWPDSLQKFVIQSYQRGNIMFKDNEVKQVQLSEQLQKLVDKAFSSNLINENDWNRQKLPILDNTPAVELECVLRAQAGLISGRHLTTKRKRTEKECLHESQSKPSKKPSIKENIGQKGKLKKEIVSSTQYQTDKDVSEGPVDYTLLTEKRLNDFNSNERMKQRSQRFESPKPQSSPNTSVESSNVIVGRCQDLEKYYLRLTSAPDPEKVRPPEVLTKSVEYILSKYNENKTYSYLINQFKSVRQDLTVQHIKNDFTIYVYETNAKLSIENNDLGEFNQCQSQLKYLYYLKRKNNDYLQNKFYVCELEFIVYRIIYMIMTNNYSEIYKLKSKILTTYSTFSKSANETKLFEFIESLFKLHQDIVVGDYYNFFRLLNSFKDRPELSLALQLFNNFIVHKNRVRALATISKSYRRVQIDFIIGELYFEDKQQFITFLDKYKLTSFINESEFDCASARPLLTEIITKPNFNKVDIKGQI